MKTWKELLTEINAIKTAMRIPWRELCSVKLSERGILLVIDIEGGAVIKDKLSAVYLGNMSSLPPFLATEVRNALESELTSLRAQASEELKTLALIAAGATP